MKINVKVKLFGLLCVGHSRYIAGQTVKKDYNQGRLVWFHWKHSGLGIYGHNMWVVIKKRIKSVGWGKFIFCYAKLTVDKLASFGGHL